MKKRGRKNRAAAPPPPARPASPPALRLFFAPPLLPAADAPVWRYLPVVLFAAFIARAAVALSGDFVLHPDEIMQYLEPAHRVVFGSGISYWEYFYGARSWIVPGFVAAVLQFCALLGLDSPAVYIAAVKLAFCLLSLLIPAGMYVVARRMSGETAGRIALVAGAFWYEFAGFAHKPMTEFTATALLLALMVVALRAGRLPLKRAFAAGVVAALLVAVRFQYAPVAALVLLAAFIPADNRARIGMVAAGLLSLAAVGALEYFTWGKPFHSYWTNLQFNLHLGAQRSGESSAWIFPQWLFLASGGVYLFVIAVACRRFLPRYRFWLLLLAVLLLPHMMQTHREYRFIFAALPVLWILFADILAASAGKAAARARKHWRMPAVAAYVAVVSLAGIFNALPLQDFVYKGFSRETGQVKFIRGQDPVFALYRHLAGAENVHGVYDARRTYFNTGGYYYLHRKVPFYDVHTGARLIADKKAAGEYVSHIIAGAPVIPQGVVQSADGRLFLRFKNEAQGADMHRPLPALINDKSLGLVYWRGNGAAAVIDGFSPQAEFGHLRLWARDDAEAPVKRWAAYEVAPDNAALYDIIVQSAGYSIREAAADFGIVFSR